MKHIRRFLMAALLLVTSSAWAYDFEVDGVYYNIISNSAPYKVEVTYESNYNGYASYSGNVVIPQIVSYSGKNYSVLGIGNDAFGNCTSLTSVTIPNSVTSIGNNAFSGCTGLTSFTIPNSVTSIGECAFMGCAGLTSIIIPNSVTNIDWYNPFSGCSGLTSIKVASGNPKYDSRNNCNAIIEKSTNELRSGCKNTNIPNSVKSIGGEAFWGCIGMTSITIPNSVTGIGIYAFYDCTSLTSVIIPNSVESIGAKAFCNCSALTSINIPKSVYGIVGGGEAFFGCSNLASITVESGNPSYDSRNNCNAIINKRTNSLLLGCKNTVIPNSVTSIGYGAFKGCYGLSVINIPNSVTSIGTYAFCGCTGLTSITIPNSVTSIGYYAFSGCTSMSSIIIPNSVTSIGDHALYECCGLTSVILPNSLTNIMENVFGRCTGLTSVTIPNSVTSIGNYAFSGCTSLASIAIPNSVTSIGAGAFLGTCLTAITIPNSVTSIGNQAFDYCNSLSNVTVLATNPPSLGNNAFSGSESIPLYVPCGFGEEYANAEGWNAFTNIIDLEIVFEAFEVISGDESLGSVRVIQQPDCDINIATILAEPVEGYCFSNWTSNGEIISISNPYTFEVEDIMLLVANFYGASLNVSSSDETLGSVLITQQPDCENKVATVFAQPYNGNLFLNWTVNGEVVSTANPYTFVLEDDISLVANFYGTGVDEETTRQITVAPNPTMDRVRITCEDMKSLTLCTLEGKTAKMFDNLNTDETEIDLDGLPKGLYLLRIELQNGLIVNKKIIIQ